MKALLLVLRTRCKRSSLGSDLAKPTFSAPGQTMSAWYGTDGLYVEKRLIFRRQRARLISSLASAAAEYFWRTRQWDCHELNCFECFVSDVPSYPSCRM